MQFANAIKFPVLRNLLESEKTADNLLEFFVIVIFFSKNGNLWSEIEFIENFSVKNVIDNSNYAFTFTCF